MDPRACTIAEVVAAGGLPETVVYLSVPTGRDVWPRVLFDRRPLGERFIQLDVFHIELIRVAAAAATTLGMPSSIAACRSHHDLWTAANLIHELAHNDLWRVGLFRPAGVVRQAMRAAQRLNDRAIAFLGEPEGEVVRR